MVFFLIWLSAVSAEIKSDVFVCVCVYYHCIRLHQGPSGVPLVFSPLSARWTLVFGVTAPQQSNNPPQRILFTGIIILDVMHPGTSVTVIPTKSSVWGACVCVIVYHRYYLLLLWVLWLSFRIQRHVLQSKSFFSETEITQRQKMKKIKPGGWICLFSLQWCSVFFKGNTDSYGFNTRSRVTGQFDEHAAMWQGQFSMG